jgi:hypothetical protein
MNTVDIVDTNECTDVQYVYLIHRKDFVDSNAPVYKIGRTKQQNLARFNSYPKGSKLLLQSSCGDCESCEQKIIYHFDRNYIKRRDIGLEYYEGDYKKMKEDIEKIIRDDDHEFEERERQNLENIIIYEPINVIENIVIDEPINVIDKNHKFHCEKCVYSTDIKYNFQNHCKSKTHLDKQDNVFQAKYQCENCKKKYITQSGLWKHKKYCKKSIKIEKPLNKNILLEFIEKQNNELVEIKNTIKEMKEAIIKIDTKINSL